MVAFRIFDSTEPVRPMPTYDYECKACGHRFEELQSFSEPTLKKCPACKKNKLERLFGGGGAIIFKGSGFYETDYRRTAEKKPEGEAAPKTDGETKTDAPAKTEATPAAAAPAATETAPAAAPAKAPAKSTAKKKD